MKHKRYKLRSIFYLITLASLAVFVFLAHGKALENGLVFDDTEQVLYNSWITSFHHIPEMFTQHVWGFSEFDTSYAVYYRPLMHVVYAVEYSLFGLDVQRFHFVQLFIHASNTFLVFLLCKKLLPRFIPRDHGGANQVGIVTTSYVAAVVFGTYPTQSEVANWIATLPEALYAFFLFLALLLYLREGVKERALSVFLFACALFSKETAVVFPVVLFVLSLVTQTNMHVRKVFIEWVKKDWMFLAVLLCFLLIRQVVFTFSPLHTYSDIFAPFIMLMAVVAYGPVTILYHMAQSFFPFEFSTAFVKDFTQISVFHSILSGIFYAVGICLLLFRPRVHGRWLAPVLFSVSWFLLFLLPACVSYFPLSQRYGYVAFFGIVFVFAVGCIRLQTHLKPIRAGVICALFCLVVVPWSIFVSRERSGIWKSTTTLFEDSARKYPGVSLTHSKLAQEAAIKGDVERFEQHMRAIKNYDKELKKGENAFNEYHYFRGFAFLVSGQYENAMSEYRRIMRQDTAPKRFQARVLRDMGVAAVYINGEQPLSYFSRAMRMQPASPRLPRLAAQYFCFRGNRERANAYFLRARNLGEYPEKLLMAKSMCDHDNFLESFLEVETYLYEVK